MWPLGSAHAIKRGWLRGMVGATFLGLIPYVERALYRTTGVDIFGQFYPWRMLLIFAALGIVAGALFERRGAYGGGVSLVIGLALLTSMGFIGRHGGDGNLFYLFGFVGSAIFVSCAVVSTAVRAWIKGFAEDLDR